MLVLLHFKFCTARTSTCESSFAVCYTPLSRGFCNSSSQGPLWKLSLSREIVAVVGSCRKLLTIVASMTLSELWEKLESCGRRILVAKEGFHKGLSEERVSLQRRLPDDDQWLNPHNPAMAMYASSTCHVLLGAALIRNNSSRSERA